jgi:hypothetical protein
MSRKTYLAITGAALAIGTLASTSASAGSRPGHLQSITSIGIGSIGIGVPNIQLPQPATNHLPRPVTSGPGGGVVSGGPVLSHPPATRFGDVKLSGIKLGQSGAIKVIQGEIPPGGIGTAATGTGNGGTGTGGTGTGGTGNGGMGNGGMGNGGMGHGPRYPGTVIVTNSYPDAQYVRIHRDYGWYGRYPTTVAPVIARPVIAAAPSCLSKEYLQQGVVMFRDTCTKEWAINNTSTQTASNAACLTKTNPQDGVVMFKDICSSEWAMNPAQPPDQAQN